MGDRAHPVSLHRDICLPPHTVARHGRTEPARADQARDELRQIVGFSAADEIAKLDRLKSTGSISDQEYTRLRAKLVG